MDVVHTAAKAIDYNRYVTIALLVVALCGVTLYMGCESTTASLNAPSEKVTRAEFESEAVVVGVDFATREAMLTAQVTALNAEIGAYNMLIDAGRADLQRQDEMKMAVVALLGQTATDALEGTFNWPALVLAGFGILATGTSVAFAKDNLRKDAKIAELKEEAKA